MERAQVTFDDVAVYFTEEEWRSLREEQKSLYKEVMNDNYQMILSLNRPDLITNIELGCEPYITTARDGTMFDSWQGERLATSSRSIFRESIDNMQSAEYIPPLKRQRRYPRVNPFRWIKRYKKSNKSRSCRKSRRLEQSENENIEENNYKSPPVQGDFCTHEAGDSREGLSALCTEVPSNSAQTSEREIEQRGPQNEDRNRTSKDSQSSRTIQIMSTKYKPDLRVTLNILEEDPWSILDRGEGIADLERYALHTAETERLTSSSDMNPFRDQHNTTDQRDEDGYTQIYKGAASSPPSLPVTTEDAGKSPLPNEERHQEKTRMDSACEIMALPRKKVKHVQFSDTVTTFIIESEEAEIAEREFFNSIRLQRKYRPRVVIVSKDIKGSVTEEPFMVTRSQDFRPKATQPEQKTTTECDTLKGESQDLKSSNSMKFNKLKTTVEVGGSLPTVVCRRDTAKPPPSTAPPLQPKNGDEGSMVTRSQASKPKATQPQQTESDTPEGGSKDLKSPNSMKCNKTKTTVEVEGSLLTVVCRRDTAKPPPSTGPPLQPKNRDDRSMVTRSHDSKPNATQPEQKTTTKPDTPEGGGQDLNRDSIKCNKPTKTMEEVKGFLPNAACRRDTAEPPPSTAPPLQPKNRDEGSVVTRSEDSKPKKTQPEQTECDSPEGGSKDLKNPNSMKCNKEKTTVEVEGSLITVVCSRDTAEPPPSTGLPLQPKNRDEKSMVTRSQESKPNDTQPEQETTKKPDTPEGGSQDLNRDSIKCNKTTKTMEEVEGFLPNPACRRDTAEPPSSTEPPLQPKNRDKGSMVTRSRDSKPKATQPEQNTTAECDTLEGGSQDLKSPNSIKCNKIMKTTEEAGGSPPSIVCRRDTAEPSLSTGPPLQPKNRDEESFVTKSQHSKPSAKQPEKETTAVCDMLEVGSQDLKSQNSLKCNKMMKTMEEVEGSPPSAVCGSDTTDPSPSTDPQLQPHKQNVVAQIDLIHQEEVQQPASEIQLTSQHPAKIDKNFMKSYSCSNCGKITRRKSLNDQQKTEFLHLCKKCSRQREKSVFSPETDTPNTTPTKCATSSKNVTGSPARKRPHCSLLDDSPNASSPAKKKQRQDVKGNAETPRSSTNPSGQLKKGEEASLRTLTSHNVQLKKVEEVSLRTSTNPNVQLKKGEASPRTSVSDNVQLKKSEEASLRTPNSQNVQLKKGETSPRTSTTHSFQLKKAKASPKTSTSLGAQLKRGEGASPRSSTSPNVRLKKGEEALTKTHNPNAQPNKNEASLRTSTSDNVQLKTGEEPLLRTSASHSIQLKKSEEASLKQSSNYNAQLKKGEASPRTSTNHSGHLKKGEEASLRTSVSHNIQLKKSEGESQRTITYPNAQLNKGEEESLRTSTNHNAQLKKNADNKKCLAAQNVHTDTFNLCTQCRPCESPEHAELSHKVKTINKTAKRSSSTKVISSPYPKNDTPEKKKSNQIPQNKPSPVQEQKLASDSESSKGTTTPQDQKNSAQTKKDTCGKCGKPFPKKQKAKPLAHIQKPVHGGSTISTDKFEKTGTKSDSVRKKQVKKSLSEAKVKRPRNADGTKTPEPPRGAKDKVLCLKCGKRVALHAVPSQDSPREGGNDENECIILPRKKRKCPLAGMSPFTCSDCGKVFTRNFSLVQHRKVHTGERPHVCKVCRKAFRESGSLCTHMRSHTQERPYPCTICGKCFTQNSALHVHLRRHTDERPFQCQECGKNFIDRSTYRHHLRIHTGEKPYACSFCGKKFTQQPQVRRHERIHTGEKPFQCELCEKAFSERTKLQKHERVHQKGNVSSKALKGVPPGKGKEPSMLEAPSHPDL